MSFVTFPRAEECVRAERGVTFATCAVTFVTRAGWRRSGSEDAVPDEGEAAGGRAAAQAVGAFPAHAHRGGGPGHAAGPGELRQEVRLAVEGPAVPSGWLRTGTARSRMRHRGV
ncbi:MAG: hypothetical protein AVDCRST_MAG31-375 [uncultured Sphingomonas sp.]|uniref:Uncharacterized protein n=1 Tax=uncultured Sphingomonas sp. TaxID=158754 RepID=A0A6J4SQ82_9SPHN|nr:MAG: hypothetical protein AVDCRST_MAG31-375 [uncultured Sphingomonas sp.]